MKIQPSKNCIICKKPFTKSVDWNYKDWDRRKFCSMKCRRGSKRPLEERKRISETCKRKGIGKWMTGRKRPVHLRIRHSGYMKDVVASGKHNFWKGGISEHTRKWRSNFQNTIEYRLWRTAVFERDNYTCVWCGTRNGNGRKVILNADHILPFADYPELRLAIDNGRTLCRECHYKRHTKNSQ